MKQKKYSPILVFVLILLVSQFLHSQSNYQYIHSPKDDVYFGYITYTEVERDGKDPVVIREGVEAPQVAVLNFPLLPGDVIRTSATRRCEIQLDTGTIIRLDLNTELKIETIMAKSLSTSRKITNFLLNRGEIFIMYKRYNYPEIFQVITPNASAKLNHKTITMIEARENGNTDIQVKKGKASVLYGPSRYNLQEEVVKKSERLTITRKHQALQGEYAPDMDFELWN
ncbi:MAG: FecR domain-containing protein, partial [Candidatus Aminicenantes bacterium]|nr:FecR domain-containing protein [Candidatus Aminicenantes bacterium]